MKFIRKNGRVIPIKESARGAKKGAIQGAKIGAGAVAATAFSHYVTKLITTGKTKRNFKFLGKAFAFGITSGAAAGAFYGARKKPVKVPV